MVILLLLLLVVMVFQDDDWIFAQSMWGTETYYRPNPDGTIKVKVSRIKQHELLLI